MKRSNSLVMSLYDVLWWSKSDTFFVAREENICLDVEEKVWQREPPLLALIQAQTWLHRAVSVSFVQVKGYGYLLMCMPGGKSHMLYLLAYLLLLRDILLTFVGQ